MRGAPGYSLDQAHHLPIEMDPLIGMLTHKNKFWRKLLADSYMVIFHKNIWIKIVCHKIKLQIISNYLQGSVQILIDHQELFGIKAITYGIFLAFYTVS